MTGESLRSVTLLLAGGYIIGGVAAVGLSLAMNGNREHIGFAFLTGSIASIVLLRRLKTRDVSLRTDTRTLGLVCLITFMATASISIFFVVSIHLEHTAPLEFFLAVTASSYIIVLQILLMNVNDRRYNVVVILEILVLSMIVGAAFLYQYPENIGNDSPYHVAIVDGIFESGRIESSSGYYSSYPFYHLLLGEIEQCVRLDLKDAQLVAAGAQLCLLFFIYLATRRLLGNRVALMALLLVTMAPHLLQPRFSFYPGAFSVTLIAPILFLVCTRDRTQRHIYAIPVISLFLGLLASHPLTPVLLIASLTILFFAARVADTSPQIVSARIVVAMTIFTIAWWGLASRGEGDTLFGSVVESMRLAMTDIDSVTLGQVTLSATFSWFDVFLYDAGFVILLMVSILGSFYVIYYGQSHNGWRFAGVTYKNCRTAFSLLTLVVVPIPYVMAVLLPTSFPDRWFPLLELLMAIEASVIIIVAIQSVARTRYRAIMGVGVSVVIFFMLSSPIVNQDSNLYSTEMSTRGALLPEEIAAREFILLLDDDAIRGNSKYLVFLSSELGNSTNYLNPEEPGTYAGFYLIVRDFDMHKGFTIPLYGAEGKLLEIVKPTREFDDYLGTCNTILDNGQVRVFSQ